MTRHPPADSRPPSPRKETAGETLALTGKKHALRKGFFHFPTAVAYPFGIGVPRPLASRGIPDAGGDAMGRYGARIFAARLFRLLGPLRPDRRHHPVPHLLG